MKQPSLAALALVTVACVRVEAGTDPGPLGYGPGPHALLADGYDSDPVPRPAPTPWTPPERELGYFYADSPEEETEAEAEPVPFNEDLVVVCDHLASLADPPDPDLCLGRYRIERVFRTITDWKTLAACIEAAADQAAVAACEQATPRAIASNDEYPRESAVCMHIFAVTIVEQLGAEPMLDREHLLEFEPLLTDCVNSLVTEERGTRKPAEYVEMLDCIERTQSSAAAEACE